MAKSARGGVQGRRTTSVKHGVRTVPTLFDWNQVRGLFQDLIDSHNESRWLFSLFSGFGDKERKNLSRQLAFLAKDNKKLEETISGLNKRLNRLDQQASSATEETTVSAIEGVVAADGSLPLAVAGLTGVVHNAVGNYKLEFVETFSTNAVMLLTVTEFDKKPYRIAYRRLTDYQMRVYVMDKDDVLTDAEFSFYFKDRT